MNLHEYQAKSLFRAYGIPVPAGEPAKTPEKALEIAQTLGGNRWVVKAQVHSGGRGKAGGVDLAEDLPVETLLIEEVRAFERELYLSILVDRGSARILFMGSAAGGMDIEKVAEETPEKILTTTLHPAAGFQAFTAREMAEALGLQGVQVKALEHLMRAMLRLLEDKDLSQIEINPLIVTKEGKLQALDAKISVDDNALFLHPDLQDLRDLGQEDATESKAREHDLSYVTLDGTIGCMVNGAGLAMATLDVIKLHGGEPANFLDVGGGTTAAKVAEAFKLILSDHKVKVLLVNIFGGIVRCNLIAEGIIAAVQEVGVTIPIIVRLEGTNAEEGRALLEASGLALITASDLDDAAKKAVEASQ